MVTLSKEVQSLKARSPMLVTQLAMVTLSKEVQCLKALFAMLVTQWGMLTLSKEVQCLKQPFAMLVTQSGMVMLFNEVQFSKAPLPIQVTESGMVTLSKELQPSKAPSRIQVTESGMVTLSKEAQPSKAASPISVTESGMVTFTSRWHNRKDSSSTLVTVWGMFTWQNSSVWTSSCVAASTSFRLYMTVTSGFACNPDSFSVWASSSNSEPFNISTFRIFCSMGSPQNFSRSIHFNCSTVSMLVTSRVKASPFKMFTVNSCAMAASMDEPQTREQKSVQAAVTCHRQTIDPKELSCNKHWCLFELPSTWTQIGEVDLCNFSNVGFLDVLSTSVNMTCCCSAAWITSPLRPVRLEPGGYPYQFDQACLQATIWIWV